MAQPNIDGEQFENEVASLYTRLGYTVHPNRDVGGAQVDMTASRRETGANETKLMIECKYRSSGAVSNEEVQKFAATFESSGMRFGFHKAIIVTNTHFSKSAHIYADSNKHVILKTIKELEYESLDIFPAYGRYMKEYKTKSIFSLYIPLSCTGYLPSKKKKQTLQFENAEFALIDWIDKGNPGFMTVMADFGAGKTTLLERIKFHYSTQYEQGKEVRKPVIFLAKELHRYPEFDDFIYATFKREFGTNVETSYIKEMIANGEFIVLIDGFDEVSQQFDEKTRKFYFLKLSSLINENTFSIMTCRPAYFVSTEEFDGLIDNLIDGESDYSNKFDRGQYLFDRKGEWVNNLTASLAKSLDRNKTIRRIRNLSVGKLTLNLFNKAQIDTYLEQRSIEFKDIANTTWTNVRDFLFSIYNIQDLMSRPILINMICTTVLNGFLNLDEQDNFAGPSQIYESYILYLFHRELTERDTRNMLSIPTRQALLELAAMAFFKTNSMDGSFKDLVSEIRYREYIFTDRHPDLEDYTTEALASDIALTGFLSKDADNKYRFAHRSFLEYAIARHIVRCLEFKFDCDVQNMHLNQEISYFLGSLLITDQSMLRLAIKNCREGTPSNEIWKNNIARAIFSIEREHEGFSIFGVNIFDIASKSVRLRSVVLEDVSIQLPALSKVSLRNCNAKSLTISESLELEISDESVIALDANQIKELVTVKDSKCEIVIHSAIRCIHCSSSIVALKAVGRIDVAELEGGQVDFIGPATVNEISLHTDTIALFETLLFQRFGASGARIAFAEGPKIQVLDRALGIVPQISIKRSFISMPITAQTPLIFEDKVDGVFEECRLAGLFVAQSLYELIDWSGCKGLLLVQSSPGNPIPMFWTPSGLLVADKRQVLSERKSFEALLSRASSIGNWMESWVETARVAMMERW